MAILFEEEFEDT